MIVASWRPTHSAVCSCSGSRCRTSIRPKKRLLATMRGAGDRSTGSDELADHITDWPTRYHLSRLRSNVLRPLRLEVGMRVLDAGAGTGVLSRYLGELGLEVLALEGNIQRARVAQARCEGLPGVTVACGPLDALDDPAGFDVVLLNGVLEYSASILGGGAGAAELLQAGPAGPAAQRRRSWSPSRTSWASSTCSGTPRTTSVGRSWGSRATRTRAASAPGPAAPSAGLLAEAGLAEQRWLYPFPDYKLPIVLLDDRLYDRPDAERIVDQIVRDPARDFSAQAVMRADARRVHRTFLEAGLGRDIANSFLVVASADATTPDALLGTDVIAWRYGDERRRVWLRSTTVTDEGERLVAHQERLYGDAGLPEAAFVRQQITRRAALPPGLDARAAVHHRRRSGRRTTRCVASCCAGTSTCAPSRRSARARVPPTRSSRPMRPGCCRRPTSTPHSTTSSSRTTSCTSSTTSGWCPKASMPVSRSSAPCGCWPDRWSPAAPSTRGARPSRSISWLSPSASGAVSPSTAIGSSSCGRPRPSSRRSWAPARSRRPSRPSCSSAASTGCSWACAATRPRGRSVGWSGTCATCPRSTTPRWPGSVRSTSSRPRWPSQQLLLEEITEQLAETTGERNQLRLHNAEMIGVITRINSRLPMKVYLRTKALVGRFLG